MEEIWRPIANYEQYLVSSHGRIQRRGRMLQLTRSRDYNIVCLCKNGIANSQRVARLVAAAFIHNDDPATKLTVDHINNKEKRNDNITNLRWASHHEQMMNRDYPAGITTQKNITKQGIYYKVQIKRNRVMVYTKLFKTLEEAIEARDAYLTANPSAFSYIATQSIPTVAPEPLQQISFPPSCEPVQS